MRACAVGVKGRGAAVEVRRQCSTSVDDMSTAPPFGRDAAARGAEFEAGRHGGGAEIEAAAQQSTFTSRAASQLTTSPSFGIRHHQDTERCPKTLRLKPSGCVLVRRVC